MAGLNSGVVGGARWGGVEDDSGEAQRRESESGEAREATAQTLSVLVRTIEGEVIPRLMLAHRTEAVSSGRHGSAQSMRPSADEVAEIARLVVAHDLPIALEYVGAMRARGMPLETIFLELLAPAARHLGDMWNEDLCDFTDVTLGLCRLHQALTQLGASSRADIEPTQNERRALLAPAPGEQHTFGVLMVSEFFRRAGWDTAHITGVMEGDVVQAVRSDWYDVVGFSLSCESRVERLAAAVNAVRRASRNPSIGVLVGGRVFAEKPELVVAVGADVTATDGRQAPHQARELLELVARRC